jgi:Mor family transcriptional regulator
MKARRIKAKEALADIRAGMDDIALMKKYRLSAQGLQDLFTQLGEAGIIKHLNAQEVLADLRAGISGDDLMKKYRLSTAGMQSLFQELDRAGLLKGRAEENGVPAKVVIGINQIVEDIKAGLTKPQLMKKYRLSSRALRWVSMTLVTTRAIAWQEILDKLGTSYEELVPKNPRRARRYSLLFDCPVYEADNPGDVGQILDVADGGMRVRGIDAKAGDVKSLVVPEDRFMEFARFTFDAQCKWVRKDPEGAFVAGFEISYISIGNLKEFQLLLHLVRFGNGQAKSR